MKDDLQGLQNAELKSHVITNFDERMFSNLFMS